ncbi:MAG TPA: DNA replication/repair protein RecF [Alphaproteobacteria bacterium]|nr:DNA replication/repair protein RecF [Alphaproteobacteria bacterium]
MALRLKKISLTNFRNYAALRLEIKDARIVVLAGENGAGKTNILEAVSLLAPGKGLRSADLGDMTTRYPETPAQSTWAVAAELQNAAGDAVRIGTGLDRRSDGRQRRVVRIDGKDAGGQGALSAHVAAVWLTPQMDRLFLEGTAARRRFLDRLVFAHSPDHVTHLNRYEKNMRSRLKLLTGEEAADPKWLDALEQQMAADAVSVTAARQHLLARLTYHLAELSAVQSLFPSPVMALSGKLDQLLAKSAALQAEEKLQDMLRSTRRLDAETGRTTEGAHRSDLIVHYADKNMPADQCSTGEQKGLLVSIILAHALMMQAEKGFVPLLLLDEVAAHLDDARRAQLFAHLRALDGQVWLTGTDAAIFRDLDADAAVFRLAAGDVRLETPSLELAAAT